MKICRCAVSHSDCAHVKPVHLHDFGLVSFPGVGFLSMSSGAEGYARFSSWRAASFMKMISLLFFTLTTLLGVILCVLFIESKSSSNPRFLTSAQCPLNILPIVFFLVDHPYIVVVAQNIEKGLIRGVNCRGRFTAKDQALISSKLLFLKRNVRRAVNWYVDEQKALIAQQAQGGEAVRTTEGGGEASAVAKEESETDRWVILSGVVDESELLILMGSHSCGVAYGRHGSPSKRFSSGLGYFGKFVATVLTSLTTRCVVIWVACEAST